MIAADTGLRLFELGFAAALAHTGLPATPFSWFCVGFDAFGEIGPGLPVTVTLPGRTVSAPPRRPTVGSAFTVPPGPVVVPEGGTTCLLPPPQPATRAAETIAVAVTRMSRFIASIVMQDLRNRERRTRIGRGLDAGVCGGLDPRDVSPRPGGHA